MLQTFPRVPYTNPNPAQPCDSHYEEVTATREIHYTVMPGTDDEHGSSLAICGDEACEAKARAYIEHVGNVVEIVEISAVAA